MKSHSQIVSLVLLGIALFLTGCHSTLRFKVVDGETKEGISGVEIRWATIVQGFPKASSRRTTNLGPFEVTNVIELTGVRLRDVNSFAFKKDGYSDSCVYIIRDSLWLNTSCDVDAKSSKSPLESDLIIIPMFKSK